MIPVCCSTCGHTYQLKGELAGRRAKCGCGAVLIVPKSAEPVREAVTVANACDASSHADGSSADAYSSTFDKPTPREPAATPRASRKVVQPARDLLNNSAGAASRSPWVIWAGIAFRLLLAVAVLVPWVVGVTTGTRYMSFDTLVVLNKVNCLGSLCAVLAFSTMFEKSKRPVVRLVTGVAIVLAVAVIWLTTWSSGRTMTEGRKPTRTDGRTRDVSFAEFDSKFGLGVLTNAAQWSKTSQQMQSDLDRYMGVGVAWEGRIVDVQDGQVLIKQSDVGLANEVALIVGWWDEWRLEGLQRGSLIRYSGVINGIGRPYPYAITNGVIRSIE